MSMMAISVMEVIRIEVVGAIRPTTRITTGAENKHTMAKLSATAAGLFNKKTSLDSPSSADNASQVSTNTGTARDKTAVRISPTSRRLGRFIADAVAVAINRSPTREEGL